MQPHLDKPTREEAPTKRKFRIVQVGYEYEGNEEDAGSQVKGGDEVVWEGDLMKPEDLPRGEIFLPESSYVGVKDAPSVGDQDFRYALQEEDDGEWRQVKLLDPNFGKEPEQPTE